MIGAYIDWHRLKGRRKPKWRFPLFAEQLHSRLCDWSKVITWSLWREPKTLLRTPVCLARAGLIVRDPKGIPKWPSKIRNGIVHHKSDHKLCVIPTADRNNRDYRSNRGNSSPPICWLWFLRPWAFQSQWHLLCLYWHHKSPLEKWPENPVMCVRWTLFFNDLESFDLIDIVLTRVKLVEIVL